MSGFEVTAVPGDRMIVAVAKGKTTFADAQAVMDDIAAALEGHDDWGILIDGRGSGYAPSAADIKQHIASPTVQKVRRHRMALVVEPGLRFGIARMFASLMEATGGDVHASTDLEEARAWLVHGARNPT